MKKRKIGCAAAFLTAAALGAGTAPIQASAADGMKIVALGDSITNGYSMDGSLIASYPELVSSYFGAELVNFAEDGLTTEGLLAMLSDGGVQSELASADVVLVTIGGNDIMQPVLSNDYVDSTQYSTMTELIAAMKNQTNSDPTFSFRLQSYLNSVMPDAIKACNANIQQISAQLSSMTSGQVIIQTIYNPMDLDADDTPLATSGSMETLSMAVHSYLEGKENNTLYPVDGGVNDIINGLTEVTVVDTFTTFFDHSYFYTYINNVDVHPNSKGHLAIAETVIQQLSAFETSNENGTLLRAAYTGTDAESTLSGVNSALNDSILGRVLKNCYGDVDANGVVEIADATAALSIYAANGAGITPEITGVNAQAADGNQDGAVDISDATLMLSYYAANAAGVFDGTFMEYAALN